MRALWMEDYSQYQRAIVVLRISASSTASIISFIIILAITIPLLARRNRKRPSTYNLYLAYLAFPDLVCHCFLVYLYSTYEDHTDPLDRTEKFSYISHPFHHAIIHGCMSAVLYISAFIAHELLKLMRCSMCRCRCKAPTLRTATIQALIAYILGDMVFMWDYFIVNKAKNVMPMWSTILLNALITVFIPFFYLIWVCIRVWREKLLCNGLCKAGKRLSNLVIYFSRIIATICWMPPVMVLYAFNFAQSTDENHKSGREYYYASVLYAIQVFVSFGLALTKPDVRKSVVSLLTCYRRPRQSKRPEHLYTEDDSPGEYDEERPHTSASTTVDSNDPDIDPNIFHFDGVDAPIDIDPPEGQSGEELQPKSRFHWLRRISHDSSSMFRSKDRGNSSISPFALEGIGGSAADTNMEASIRASLSASLPPNKSSFTFNSWVDPLGIPQEVEINDDDTTSDVESDHGAADRHFRGKKLGATTITMAGVVRPINGGYGDDSDSSESTYG